MCTHTCGMCKSQKTRSPITVCAHARTEPCMRTDARTEARLRTRQARKYKAMCLAGPDASKVAIGRLPPQVGILLANSTKASRILCSVSRLWSANADALAVCHHVIMC